jgi:hypothetical protein
MLASYLLHNYDLLYKATDSFLPAGPGGVLGLSSYELLNNKFNFLQYIDSVSIRFIHLSISEYIDYSFILLSLVTSIYASAIGYKILFSYIFLPFRFFFNTLGYIIDKTNIISYLKDKLSNMDSGSAYYPQGEFAKSSSWNWLNSGSNKNTDSSSTSPFFPENNNNIDGSNIMEKFNEYKNQISEIDKKAVREIVKKERTNG